MADAAARPRGPERTCIGCRRKSGPTELVRFVRRPDGSLAVGRSEPGRGAWLCAGSESCFDTAQRRRAFARALRGDVPAHELPWLRERLLSGGANVSGALAGHKLEGVGGE